MDCNGAIKSLIVRDGFDVCVGNVFQSLITALGMNECTPGSDTNMFEIAFTQKKIRHIVS